MVTAKDVNAVLKNQVDPVDPIDPIAAVSHSDPYPYYAALRAKSGVHWFADLKLWGLVNAPLITDAFNMEQAKVRPTGAPVPAFMHGRRRPVRFLAGWPACVMGRSTHCTAHVRCC